MAGANNWSLGSPVTFELKDKKEGFATLASDDKLVVCGCSGWNGLTKVYDVTTGELKFTLNCNQAQDMPEPFSWDNILADIGTSVIVTVSLNDNTLSLWDINNGSMLYRSFESEGEADLMAKFFGTFDKGGDSIKCVKAVGDKILAGTEKRIDIFEKVNEEWKKTGKIGPENHQIIDIDIDGKWAALTGVDYSMEDLDRDSLIKVFLWDLEEDKLITEYTRDSSLYRDITLAYPYVFLVGSLKRSSHKYGLRVLNMETGEIVRQVLKDEKQYETICTNGNIVAICEHINTWISGEEKMLKLAIYDVQELGNPEICEEHLWCKTFEYLAPSVTMEHIRCTLTSKNLIINHDGNKISIMDLTKEG